MGEAAAKIASARLVKVKVDASAPAAQIEAVHRAAPAARLIVDPNESWNIDLLRDMQPALATLDVALVEQPLPAADDAALEGFESAVPICADESCHVAADLPRLQGRYQRSEEHTSELQSLMRNSYAVLCLKKKTKIEVTAYYC